MVKVIGLRISLTHKVVRIRVLARGLVNLTGAKVARPCLLDIFCLNVRISSEIC
jgi:hypothetical protein